MASVKYFFKDILKELESTKDNNIDTLDKLIIFSVKKIYEDVLLQNVIIMPFKDQLYHTNRIILSHIYKSENNTLLKCVKILHTKFHQWIYDCNYINI